MIMITLSKKNFGFYEIGEEFKKNFIKVSNHELSDFHAEALKWIGDAIREKNSQHFWCDSCYCWYTDATQNHEKCVWMTENGIAMFEDMTERKLFRIEFNR